MLMSESTASISRSTRLRMGEGRTATVFSSDSPQMAKFLGHEDRQAQQLAQAGWIARRLGGSDEFRDVLDKDADNYAKTHNDCRR